MNKQTEQLRTAKLIMVTAHNNNKYYEMRENGDGTFSVTYGRVGGRATRQSYPVVQWERKYNEKVRKGYKDQTHLFAENSDEIELADIDDATVQRLINKLTAYAKKSISRNYNVTADQVTQKQVDEAQYLLDELLKMSKIGMATQSFNNMLLQLYQVIPRKMAHVRTHLIQKPIIA